MRSIVKKKEVSPRSFCARTHSPTLFLSPPSQGVVKNSYCVVIGSMIGTESILLRALDIGRQKGWVESGANVVCVHGTQEAVPGSSNMLRVMIA
jgi:hypothetical protein